MNIWSMAKDIRKVSLEIFPMEFWNYVVVFFGKHSQKWLFWCPPFSQEDQGIGHYAALEVSYLIKTSLNTLQNVIIKPTRLYNSKVEFPI